MADTIPDDIDLSIGDAGLRHSGGRMMEEWHADLRGRQGIKTYRQMRDNSATIGAMMFLLRSIVTALDWPVRRASVGDDMADQAEEAAQYIEEVLFSGDMESPWSSFIESGADVGFTYGFALFEIVLKIRGGLEQTDPRFASRYSDRRVGVRKLALRPAHTIDRWDVAEDGEVMGVHQLNPMTGRATYLPMGKLLHLRTTESTSNPEGRSLLRNAYRSWYYASNLEEIEAIGIERELCGLPVFEVPPKLMSDAPGSDNDQRIADIKKQGQEIRSDERGCVVMPAAEVSDRQGNIRKTGYKFYLAKSGGTRAIDTNTVIGRHKMDSAMSVMTEMMFLGSNKVGTEALATIKYKMMGSALGGLVDTLILGPVNNRLIPMLMEMNPDFPREVWPTIDRSDVVAPSLEEVAAFVKEMVAGGVIIPDPKLEAAMRARGDLPDRVAEDVSEEDFQGGVTDGD